VARAQQGVGLVETPLTGELIAEIEESACLDMAGRLQKVELALPDMNATVDVSFVGPKDDKSKAKDGKGEKPAIVMVHGFDSSCLEFRRLFPILEEDFEVYAVDVLGWGFTDSKGQDCGPKYKGAALVEFIKSVVKRPVTMLGASLGGAVAIDLAASYPDLVSKLVLVDAQGFKDGLGVLQYLPEFIIKPLLEVLRSVPLRQSANKMSYFNKDNFATEDALKVGRLHCFKEDWISGNLTFIKAGGFSVSESISGIGQPTLVIWGDNDEILPAEDKFKFVDAIRNCNLRIVPECGHVPHLEKPEEVKFHLQEFL